MRRKLAHVSVIVCDGPDCAEEAEEVLGTPYTWYEVSGWEHPSTGGIISMQWDFCSAECLDAWIHTRPRHLETEQDVS